MRAVGLACLRAAAAASQSGSLHVATLMTHRVRHDRQSELQSQVVLDERVDVDGRPGGRVRGVWALGGRGACCVGRGERPHAGGARRAPAVAAEPGRAVATAAVAAASASQKHRARRRGMALQRDQRGREAGCESWPKSIMGRSCNSGHHPATPPRPCPRGARTQTQTGPTRPAPQTAATPWPAWPARSSETESGPPFAAPCAGSVGLQGARS